MIWASCERLLGWTFGAADGVSRCCASGGKMAVIWSWLRLALIVLGDAWLFLLALGYMAQQFLGVVDDLLGVSDAEVEGEPVRGR